MPPAMGILHRQAGGSVWLITLADLVALLLTFFVLIFSMSTIRGDRWEAVVDGLSGRVHEIVPPEETVPPASRNIASREATYGIGIGYIEALLRGLLPRDPVLAEAVLRRAGSTLVVSLPADLLFASGSDALHDGSREALFRLGGLLGNLRNEVAVIGHTDPDPISSGRFPSNWELALARAASVSVALRRAGYRREIAILGAADGWFSDIPAEMDEAGRYARARRVDLLIRDTRGH